MAKSTMKKKGLSEKKTNVKKKSKSVNPFEVHLNKQKFNVLGRKLKNDIGLPGVARAKALKKRKETLLQEYKIKDKSNKFLDKRIGEKNSAMTDEDKIIARFTVEHMKAHRKKTMYNLADEETLTHRGRALAEIERFDDPRSDDEEDINVKGGLDAKFVEEAHFGGGILKKSENSRLSVIDQLIADSKKRKAEKQESREKTIELTETLDKNWKDLLPCLNYGKPPEAADEKKDPYDVLMNELKFEARGKPSDKLKSVDEIAAQEAKKLKELEEERLRRMRGDDGSVVVIKPQHRSADDLDDGLDIDDGGEFSLEYDKEGNLITTFKDNNGDIETEIQKEKANEDSMAYKSDEEGETEEEGEDEEDSSEESEGDGPEDLSDLKPQGEEDDEEGSDMEEGIEDKEICKKPSSDESDELELATKTKENDLVSKEQIEEELEENQDEEMAETVDKEKLIEGNEISENQNEKKRKISETELKGENDGEEEASKELTKQLTPKKIKNEENSVEGRKEDGVDPHPGTECIEEPKLVVEEEFIFVKPEEKEKKKVTFNSETNEAGTSKKPKIEMSSEDFLQHLMKKKELMETARRELPYTFTVPNSYEELQTVFKDRSVEEQTVIVERMMKCHHPSLSQKNKPLLENLYAFLLQHLNDADYQVCWCLLNHLAPLLFELAHFSPSNAAHCLREVINEKHEDYNLKKQKYPPVETLLFLKLVPLLFPPSDKRHSVTTPAMIFICEMLENCQVTTRRSIASGLFLASLVIEFTGLSKRICPAAVNFLCGIIHFATPASDLEVVPPFKREHKFLFLHGTSKEISAAQLKMFGSDLSSKSVKIDDDFRVRSIFTALSLLDMLSNIYKDHPGAFLLLEPIKKHVECLQVEKYPIEVLKAKQKLLATLEPIFNKKLSPLVIPSKRPKALRLYEPNIQPVYETKKNKMMSEEKAEREKLVHKYKKEMKGALREIRRDRVFLTKIKLKEIAASDQERIQKVKQIYSWGSQQQGELNQIKRKKK